MLDLDAYRAEVEFIEQKIRVPSNYSSSFKGHLNAKGFTVAGATRAALLKDLHDIVSIAIADGQSLGQFRKSFDARVAKHGWSYRGKRGWRSEIIYSTNMRTAFSAGQWESIQRNKVRRPFLQYITVGDNNVRAEHAAWDGIVLHVDDPWWDTHTPPNGWGCRCIVRQLSQRDLDREGLTVTRAAPPLQLTERVNTRTGEFHGEAPKGIDTGWDYNVGKAWLGPDIALGEYIVNMPPALRATVYEDIATIAPRLERAYKPWAKEQIKKQAAAQQGQALKFDNSHRTVGYLPEPAVDYLDRIGRKPSTAVITITDAEMHHLLRPKKGRPIGDDAVLSMVRLMSKPDAVLFDKQKEALLFVFSSDDGEGKVVVSINFTQKIKDRNNLSSKMKTNSVRTSGVVNPENLRDPRYKLIQGEL